MTTIQHPKKQPHHYSFKLAIPSLTFLLSKKISQNTIYFIKSKYNIVYILIKIHNPQNHSTIKNIKQRIFFLQSIRFCCLDKFVLKYNPTNIPIQDINNNLIKQKVSFISLPFLRTATTSIDLLQENSAQSQFQFIQKSNFKQL